jgi:hypothetical protein
VTVGVRKCLPKWWDSNRLDAKSRGRERSGEEDRVVGYDDLANRGVGAARSAEGCEAGELVVEHGAGSVGPSYVVLIEALAHDCHAGVCQVAFRTAVDSFAHFHVEAEGVVASQIVHGAEKNGCSRRVTVLEVKQRTGNEKVAVEARKSVAAKDRRSLDEIAAGLVDLTEVAEGDDASDLVRQGPPVAASHPIEPSLASESCRIEQSDDLFSFSGEAEREKESCTSDA